MRMPRELQRALVEAEAAIEVAGVLPLSARRALFIALGSTARARPVPGVYGPGQVRRTLVELLAVQHGAVLWRSATDELGGSADVDRALRVGLGVLRGEVSPSDALGFQDRLLEVVVEREFRNFASGLVGRAACQSLLTSVFDGGWFEVSRLARDEDLEPDEADATYLVSRALQHASDGHNAGRRFWTWLVNEVVPASFDIEPAMAMLDRGQQGPG